jgi:hypothetical protein
LFEPLTDDSGDAVRLGPLFRNDAERFLDWPEYSPVGDGVKGSLRDGEVDGTGK